MSDIQFVSTDPETVQNEVIAAYEGLTKTKLYPADPVRLFLLAGAALVIQQRVLLNDAARQTLLRFARGQVLDEFGARVETPRIAAQFSKTMVRFILSAPRPDVVPIPSGTRIGPGNDLFFATTQLKQIPSGSLYVDVPASCLTAGAAGNGYLPGQINVLVDPIAYVASVSNTVTSSGGADAEADDPYRERIQNAPESFATAGPEGAYIFHAKSADSGILDVSVDTPEDSVVEIRVLMQGGTLPEQSVLDAVAAKCSDKTIRPLTDKVEVYAAEQVEYEIEYTYWVDKDDEANLTGIQTAVAAAVEDYKLWQRSKLGRDINPSELNKRILLAGAKRAVITSPEFTELDKTQVANDTATTAAFGGLEDG